MKKLTWYFFIKRFKTNIVVCGSFFFYSSSHFEISFIHL